MSLWNTEMKIVMFQPFDNENEEKKMRKTFQIYLQHTTSFMMILPEKTLIFSFTFLSSFLPSEMDGRKSNIKIK